MRHPLSPEWELNKPEWTDGQWRDFVAMCIEATNMPSVRKSGPFYSRIFDLAREASLKMRTAKR